VLDCAVRDLGPDQDVKKGGDSKEPGNPPQCSFAVKAWFGQPSADLALA